jgi:outer membrane protein OmpA-like peptidoglycan-associated protein
MGEKVTLTGNVIKVNADDTFSVCDINGAETVVVLSPSTKVTTHRRGIFRGAETLDKSALSVGLRVQVHGRGNDSGELMAKWVRFHDADLRAQTEIDTRAIPIEAEQVRQAEYLEETAGVASTALKNARTAQESADKAQSTADLAKTTAEHAHDAANAAHTKIAAIDDFESVEAMTVNFKPGSAKLSPEAKAKLDEFVAKTVNRKGFVVEISAFASSEGGLVYNHSLTEKRAEAVMDYLIGVGNVPIRRIVTPYSGGEMSPIADNTTRAGRQQNRRAEVKLLVSKGLAAQEEYVGSNK